MPQRGITQCVRQRAAFDMLSNRVGFVEAGQSLAVLEERRDSRGTPQLRCAQGWVMLVPSHARPTSRPRPSSRARTPSPSLPTPSAIIACHQPSTPMAVIVIRSDRMP